MGAEQGIPITLREFEVLKRKGASAEALKCGIGLGSEFEVLTLSADDAETRAQQMIKTLLDVIAVANRGLPQELAHPAPPVDS